MASAKRGKPKAKILWTGQSQRWVTVSPSQSLVVEGGSTKPGVAARESHSESPREGGPVGEEIVLVVHL